MAIKRFNTRIFLFENNMKSLLLTIVLFSCTSDPLSEVDFLIGTWKIEGKEQYEVWEKNKKNELTGSSYKLNGNQKTVTETLTIKTDGNRIIFEATVPDQNEGKTVPFTLNKAIKSCLSFENMEHDFPKKIQYEKIAEDEIEVTVTGDEGRGFSYSQFKQ